MRLRWWILLFIVFVWAVIPAHCSVHYTHKPKHRALMVETRMFLPSHESQLRQNEAIDALGLHRYKNDKELRSAVKYGELVPLPVDLFISKSLPKGRRYLRPWASDFLYDMGFAYGIEFGEEMQINSAVRTMQVQRSLRHWNPNAAPVHGEAASSHLAGATVDLQRRGLTLRQLFWIQNYLKRMGDRVIVIEELRAGSCIHIFIQPPVEAPDVNY